MKRRTFTFERLDVWQQARTLVKEVYDLTASFPKSESYGLVSQLRRAVVSVANNLAEGTTRNSFKEQAHFTSLAHSSLSEVACDLLLSLDLQFSSSLETEPLLEKVYDLSIRIHNLRQSQINRINDPLTRP